MGGPHQRVGFALIIYIFRDQFIPQTTALLQNFCVLFGVRRTNDVQHHNDGQIIRGLQNTDHIGLRNLNVEHFDKPDSPNQLLLPIQKQCLVNNAVNGRLEAACFE